MYIHIMPLEQIKKFVADRFEETLLNKPNAVLGMTTGKTPITVGLFEELIRRENAGQIDFSKSVMVNPDEQINIAREHSESYYDYMKKNVFNHIKQQPAKWIIPDGMAKDPQKEADRMEQEIYENGGIDFQIMGIGINGHICFIEPNSKIPSTCYVTPIAEVNRELYAKDYGNIEDVPTEAITFGLGTVLKSKELLLMAVGEGKADITKQALLEPITTELPATIMQMHNNAHVVLDTAAASKLPEDLAERAGNLFQIIRYN